MRGIYMHTTEAIKALVQYGLKTNMIYKEDIYYVSNALLDIMKYEPEADFNPQNGLDLPLEEILEVLLNDAVARNIIDSGIASRDLFDTRLMSCLMPRPSIVLQTFQNLYNKSPKEATDYFYQLSCDADYIRTYRIQKDKKWITNTKYGDLDITINLSKPEKDPKAIALEANQAKQAYPQDLLCHENEGYTGRLNHPARQTLRQIPLTLENELWWMQYSPYVYYNEHCIVLSDAHRPMKIEKATFARLLQFIEQFPHYTIGSNADLPIVGGSILAHEHFQGGAYTFAMAKANARKQITFAGYEDITSSIVEWPMSVIRLDGTDSKRIVMLADKILQTWKQYSDASCDILSHTNETPHNTITPIARFKDGKYELDLVLRNNRTTEEYPLGIFHPHQNLHHIKKENIGLIEVMGLAVLPARLLKEMEDVKKAILSHQDISSIPSIASHADWANMIVQKYGTIDSTNIDTIIENEIGYVFANVLEDAGVYKNDANGNAGFDKFIETVNKS